MNNGIQNGYFRLLREQGVTLLQFHGEEKKIPVKAVWARPLSCRGGEVSFIDRQKREIVMIDSLDVLDDDSRFIAEKILKEHYLLTTIRNVNTAKSQFGVGFWDVNTDRGHHTFAMKDPFRNVNYVDSKDRVVIRDTVGNCYEIESIDRLDKKSRKEVGKVL